MRKILIIGSTGSIGRQALDVVAGSDDLEVIGLSASRSWELVRDQAERFDVNRVALADGNSADELHRSWPDGEVLAGPQGLAELIAGSGADLVLNAIVGAAGLEPTVVALSEGIDLALANKESLVVGGELVMQLAEAKNAQIIPVDSEHSAIFQLIRGERCGGDPGTVKRLVLTASGGPFRGFSREELDDVSPSQALNHPTWNMGGKITVDSATLMNKGLELIEAHHLFEIPCNRIDVVVHPQSLVHGIAHLIDGASIAHMGPPDMKVPISYALHFPHRAGLSVKTLDLADVGELSFESPDRNTFGCLELASRAASVGGTAPCIMNAANEVAVNLFLEGKLPFLGIERVIGETMERCTTRSIESFEDLYAADEEARAFAFTFAGGSIKSPNGAKP